MRTCITCFYKQHIATPISSVYADYISSSTRALQLSSGSYPTRSSQWTPPCQRSRKSNGVHGPPMARPPGSLGWRTSRLSVRPRFGRGRFAPAVPMADLDYADAAMNLSRVARQNDTAHHASLWSRSPIGWLMTRRSVRRYTEYSD
jgi:hypothetical protein